MITVYFYRVIRTIQKHTYSNKTVLKAQLLQWAQQYEEVVWLDSNNYENQNYPSYDAILAVEAVSYTHLTLPTIYSV